ncbi:MAG: molybdenum cofactor biosynthesis protein MoaE [Gammaproteobacteria bacterium]
MHIEIHTEAFDPWHELNLFQQKLSKGHYGGTAVFVGTMRDFNEDQTVQEMTLEHYPGMTEKHLEKICRQAIDQWQLVDAMILHRVGEILPNDSIVLVAAWSAHRKEAFEASRFMIEDLKHSAPFWKKEKNADGTRWVESNTPP